MITIVSHKWEDFRFGAVENLTPRDLQVLVNLFRHPDRSNVSTLGGRQSVSKTELPGVGPVVVKNYRRGGFLSHFIEATYLKQGKPRCQIEFEQMLRVAKIGVLTPQPVAFAYRGKIFYKAWLITKEVQHQQSMAQLSKTAPVQARSAMRLLRDQVSILLDHSILHADFHPGNVLVDRKDRVYLVDFDKASNFKGPRNRLKKKYLDRWRRAVRKHDLSPTLDELLRRDLR